MDFSDFQKITIFGKVKKTCFFMKKTIGGAKVILGEGVIFTRRDPL